MGTCASRSRDDIPTTAVAIDEHKALNSLRLGATRIVVLLGNLHVDGLRAELEAVLADAKAVMGSKAVSEGAVQLTAAQSIAMGISSGDEAKAALLLRADVFERIVTVWRASVRVQTAYRSHRCSRQYDRGAVPRGSAVGSGSSSLCRGRDRERCAPRSMTTRW